MKKIILITILLIFLSLVIKIYLNYNFFLNFNKKDQDFSGFMEHLKFKKIDTFTFYRRESKNKKIFFLIGDWDNKFLSNSNFHTLLSDKNFNFIIPDYKLYLRENAFFNLEESLSKYLGKTFLKYRKIYGERDIIVISYGKGFLLTSFLIKYLRPGDKIIAFDPDIAPFKEKKGVLYFFKKIFVDFNVDIAELLKNRGIYKIFVFTNDYIKYNPSSKSLFYITNEPKKFFILDRVNSFKKLLLLGFRN